ncbi:uncharacterized protein LOC113760061 [Coffea eugenioides]|uniref:uncharacterized protein LOC113760061 n=1 Tax=Coffea eugenioides TaxID=49369 RepID=UPI000F60AB9F|nr:uncharacterized protein LOC113760061 [Coffea eugenioides]
MEIVRKGHEFFEMFVHQPNQETAISYTMAEQNAVSDIIAQLIDVNTKDDESIICTNCQIFDIINVPITRKRQTFRPLVIRESDQQSSPTTILKAFVDSFDLRTPTTAVENKFKDHMYEFSTYEHGRTSASGIDALRCIPTTPDVLPTKLDCQYCEAKRILSETPGFCCSNGQIVLQQNKLLDELIQFDMRKIDVAESFRIDVRTYNNTVIGPEMPSAELLAAAAKLTEAEAELREAELVDDSELFIGPPPPAFVSEVESSNEAERFEEITRIMGAEVDSPYDILGVNKNMSAENMKKRYWKLSLMVHPDKCSHPQAHQAFVKLNKAFKDLQDPDKRKALDEKIKLKEEQEEFKAELKAMKEAAHWRRLQGISMEGDDILLADMEAKVEPKRDEWMTTLPPERKPGMTMQSTKFSRSSKEGRGDTSVWTDTPSDQAQKAKMNYLEAYNEASALASNEQERKRSNSDAHLVDEYNKSKRSKSLVDKHQELAQNRSKKKSKQEPVKEEWEGKHPWRPWDREKDLTAGRQSVKLDAENMAQGLSSRFSSGSFQRNFL